MYFLLLWTISTICSFVLQSSILYDDDDANPKYRALFEKEIRRDQVIQMIDTSICLGTPPQCIRNMIVDTGSFGVWVPEPKTYFLSTFNKTQSLTFQPNDTNSQIHYGSGTVSGHLVSDCIYSPEINKFTENYFTFLLADNTNKIVMPNLNNGIIGFGKVYDERYLNLSVGEEKIANTSYIIYLYKNKLIDKKIFSYKQISNESSLIYVGETGLSQNETYYKCYARKIEDAKSDYERELIIDRSAFWTCQYYGLFYDNGTKIKVNNTNDTDSQVKDLYSVYFDSGANFFRVPEPYFTFLRESYLKASNGSCRPNYRYDIVCELSYDLNLLPRFRLAFKDFSLEIIPQDVFRIKQERIRIFYQFTIIKGLEPIFTIGATIMKRYQFIFDMEDGSVGILPNYLINKIENITVTLDKIKFPIKELHIYKGILVAYLSVIVIGLICLLIGIRKMQLMSNEEGMTNTKENS